MAVKQTDIENEIRETQTLEESSSAADVPNTVARNINLFDEDVSHTDTGVDIVSANEVFPPDALITDQGGTFVDIETHVDQDGPPEEKPYGKS